MASPRMSHLVVLVSMVLGLLQLASVCSGATNYATGQWASRVRNFSSQSGINDSAARQVLGPSNVYPAYADSVAAWSANCTRSGSESLELEFNNSVCVSSVAIYETFNAGGVVRISVLSPSGAWDELWRGQPSLLKASRIFAPALRAVNYVTNAVRIELNCSQASWCELDAVMLYGDPTCPGASAGDPTFQWASRVRGFSSQLSSNDSSAGQALGPPNVFPAYTDSVNAWAGSCTACPFEYLELEFSNSVCVMSVSIIETLNAGGVVRISALSPTGTWDELWSGSQTLIRNARAFTPVLRGVAYLTNAVRIELNCSLASWCQVDAVQLIGAASCSWMSHSEDLIQWASRVRGFSSQLNASDWSASQVLGTPNVYPAYIESVNAWASSCSRSPSEYIEVTFDRSVCVSAVSVYETFSAGSVVRVSVLTANGTWDELWSGQPSLITKSRVFAPSLRAVNYVTNVVRLELNCSLGSYCEVDAVQLFGGTSCPPSCAPGWTRVDRRCIKLVETAAPLSTATGALDVCSQEKIGSVPLGLSSIEEAASISRAIMPDDGPTCPAPFERSDDGRCFWLRAQQTTPAMHSFDCQTIGGSLALFSDLSQLGSLPSFLSNRAALNPVSVNGYFIEMKCNNGNGGNGGNNGTNGGNGCSNTVNRLTSWSGFTQLDPTPNCTSAGAVCEMLPHSTKTSGQTCKVFVGVPSWAKGRSCFFFASTYPVSWAQARRQCSDYGAGDLVTSWDAMLSSMPSGLNMSEVWVGMHQNQGKFSMTNDVSFADQINNYYWSGSGASQEPLDRSLSNCAYMTTDGKLKNGRCDAQRAYICEQRLGIMAMTDVIRDSLSSLKSIRNNTSITIAGFQPSSSALAPNMALMLDGSAAVLNDYARNASMQVLCEYAYPGDRICPIGWYEFKGHCYLFQRQLMPSSLAKSVCDNYGAELLSLSSMEETKFVESAFLATGTSYSRGVFVGASPVGDRWFYSDGSIAPKPDTFNSLFTQPIWFGGLKLAIYTDTYGFICEKIASANDEDLYARQKYIRGQLATFNSITRDPTPVMCNCVAPNCSLACIAGCPSGWMAYGSQCYRLYDKAQYTRDSAARLCAVFGTSLPSVANQHEMEYLAMLSRHMGLSVGTWIDSVTDDVRSGFPQCNNSLIGPSSCAALTPSGCLQLTSCTDPAVNGLLCELTCTFGKRFPEPSNSSFYYECVADGILPVKKQCPMNLVFDVVSMNCSTSTPRPVCPTGSTKIGDICYGVTSLMLPVAVADLRVLNESAVACSAQGASLAQVTSNRQLADLSLWLQRNMTNWKEIYIGSVKNGVSLMSPAVCQSYIMITFEDEDDDSWDTTQVAAAAAATTPGTSCFIIAQSYGEFSPLFNASDCNSVSRARLCEFLPYRAERSQTCPPGFVAYREVCYSYNATLVPWDQARAACQARGGDLAVQVNQTVYNVLGVNPSVATPSWVGTHSGLSGFWFDGTAVTPPVSVIGSQCGSFRPLNSQPGVVEFADCSMVRPYICQVNIDPVNQCVSNPCINNGTCVDLIDAFQCQCTEDYTGSICQTYIDPCNTISCHNGGVCRRLKFNKTVCLCPSTPPLRGGKFCDDEMELVQQVTLPSGSTSVSAPLLFGFENQSRIIGIQQNTGLILSQSSAGGGTSQTMLKIEPPLAGLIKYSLQGFPDRNVTTPGSTYQINIDIIDGRQVVFALSMVTNIQTVFADDAPALLAVNGIMAMATTAVSLQIYLVKTNECSNTTCVNNGVCTDMVKNFTCACPPAFTGRRCEQDVNECVQNPCAHSSTCNNTYGSYICVCAIGWNGTNCTQDVNECLQNPCQHGGNCSNTDGSYNCTCQTGWNGTNCELDVNECQQNICQHGSTCTNTYGSYNCMCTTGWNGTNCDIDVNECQQNNPCQHGSTCNNTAGSYNCTCRTGWNGTNCELDVNECQQNICQHDSTCSNTNGSYSCMCSAWWNGTNCDIDVDECALYPCRNGGNCTNTAGNYTCSCPLGWTGKNCDVDVVECQPNPCNHGGNCTNTPGSYYCTCNPNWSNIHCDQDVDECLDHPCQHEGTCINTQGDYNCTCTAGWKGMNCAQDVDECQPINICQNGGACSNTMGNYSCNCPVAWKGTNCEILLDHCLSHPCEHGGTCNNTVGDFICTCTAGWDGHNCSQDVDECQHNPCMNGGSCTNSPGNYSCSCPSGWIGRRCTEDVDECQSSPCSHGGTCTNTLGSHYCTCDLHWSGIHCNQDVDECLDSPCQHGGTCTNTQGDYSCSCAPGWVGINCTSDVDECQQHPCLHDGSCTNNPGSFSCSCAAGWRGPVCTEDVDECQQNPCANGGSCNNTVGSYRCTCVAGWVGSTCAIDVDECQQQPCLHEGNCTNNPGSFSCSCAAGWRSAVCAEDIDECQQNPCANGGTCNNTVGSYRCTCAAGWDGFTCASDVDECRQQPCQNGATCNNFDGGFNCTCKVGFTGRNCMDDIDECSTDVCQHGGACSNNVGGYSCSCPPTYTGRSCEQDVNECLLSQSPCQHGGTCTNKDGGYECACPPGWIGLNCDRDVDECRQNPCLHNGNCTNTLGSYTCACTRSWMGLNCRDDVNECDANPPICVHGSCTNLNGSYQCSCDVHWTGTNCDRDVDECREKPCRNGGTCNNTVGDYGCICTSGWTGTNCTQDIDECLQSPCLHNGVCTNLNGSYTCTCDVHWSGLTCAQDVDECLQQPCQNQGTCSNSPGDYSCACAAGWIGLNCKNDVDECANNDNICGHGNCTNLAGSYACTCEDLWRGPHCEHFLGLCYTQPCKHDGTCTPLEDDYACACTAGWTGRNCTEDVNECTLGNSLCGHGSCSNTEGSFRCICEPQWTGASCDVDVDECLTSPCGNGATCNNTIGYFLCTCATGWTGTLCMRDVDECAFNPTPCVHGACSNTDGSYTCSCDRFWHGTNCDQYFGDCDPNPCQNGAMCTDTNGNKVCTCASGWKGTYCAVDINECTDTPGLCTNGVCVNLDGSYQCNCGAYWTGAFCQLDVDECLLLPCQNNATCTNSPGNYNCTCASGWKGDLCAVDINECALNAKLCNHGNCTNRPGSFTCRCQPGWTGALCDVDIDECASGQCLHGATCVNGENYYACQCSPQWTGTQCQENINECLQSPCQNGGTCTDLEDYFRCTCRAGITGSRCELDIDECDLTPTLCNHGTCINQLASYRCVCDPGYTGANCQTDINECASSPCANGATCADLVAAYRCTCPLGITGKNCEVDIDECASRPCLNSGECVNRLALYSCRCPLGFVGTQCETNVDECASSPCQYGGTCRDLVGRFSCRCTDLRQGVMCELEVEKAVAVASVVVERSRCRRDWSESASNCYLLSATALNWADARMECVRQGGSLLVLDDQLTMPAINVTDGEAFTLGLRQESTYWTWVDSFPGAGVLARAGLTAAQGLDALVAVRRGGKWQFELRSSSDRLRFICKEEPCGPSWRFLNSQCYHVEASVPSMTSSDVCQRLLAAPAWFRWASDAAVLRATLTGSQYERIRTQIVAIQNATDWLASGGITLSSSVSSTLASAGVANVLFPVSGNAIDIDNLAEDSRGAFVCQRDENRRSSLSCALPTATDQSRLISVSGLYPGAAATFACKRGYRMTSGDSQRMCTSDGQWRGQPLVCELVQCPALSLLPGVTTDTKTGRVGDTAQLSCATGYRVASGRTSMRCLDSGLWDGELLRCNVTDCGRPEAGTSAVISATTTTYTSVCKYDCPSGFERVSGDRVRVCTDQAKWQGDPLACQEIHCAAGPVPPQGAISNRSSSDRRVGSVIGYTCTGLYETRSWSLTCSVNGLWLGLQDVRCTPLICPLPPRIASTVSQSPSSLDNGALTVYSCVEGYTVAKGQTKRFCQLPQRVWNGTDLVCEIVKCPALSAPTRGSVTLSSANLYGSVARIDCDSGFELADGDVLRTCNSKGQWTGLAPRCQARSCPAPPAITNGRVSTKSSYYVDDLVYYTCNDQYEMTSGLSNRTCMADRRWSGVEPKCSRIECGSPASIKYATPVVLDYGIGGRTQYTCDAGLRYQSGDLTHVCQADRTWKGEPPVCMKLVCSAPEVSPSAESMTTFGFEFGDKTMYRCSVGSSNSSGSLLRVCLPDLTWSGSAPVCSLTACTPPEQGEYAIIAAPSLLYGSTAKYACNSGYKVVSGSTERVCLDTRLWSGNALVCTPIQCLAIDAPANGFVQIPAMDVDSMAIYGCNDGYQLRNGSTNRTCLLGGIWSGVAPQCEVIRASPPVARLAVTNMQVSLPRVAKRTKRQAQDDNTLTEYPIGTQIEVECSNQTMLVGGDTILTLGPNGWEGTGPTCRPIECPEPEEVFDGTVTYTDGMSVSSEARTTCDPGFMLISGSSTRVCTPERYWTGTPPLCELKKCPVPSSGANSVWVSTVHGTVLNYRCNKGYRIVQGDKNRTCLADATWSGQPLECTIVVCPEVENGTNAKMTPRGNTYGSITTFECVRGYLLRSGSFLRTCLETGVWSDQSPVCISSSDLTKGVQEKYASAITTSRYMGGVAGAIIGVLVVSICLCDLNCEKMQKRFKKHKKHRWGFMKRVFNSKKSVIDKKDDDDDLQVGEVVAALKTTTASAAAPASPHARSRSVSTGTRRDATSRGGHFRSPSNSSVQMPVAPVEEPTQRSLTAMARLAETFKNNGSKPLKLGHAEELE